MADLVCVSHLRWDFVWQRPQHLISRLAEDFHIWFVEEPISSTEAARPHLELAPAPRVDGGGVTVVRLIQPAEEPRWIGHGDSLTQETYGRLLQAHLAAEEIDDVALWLYTPMGLQFAETLHPQLLIYDVMDELSAFKGAPAGIRRSDRQVLRRADIVFTGGLSLYKARMPYNANTYLFPSGVETAHFARAAEAGAYERPADLDTISGPILGYFGVIDERMDIPLLAHLARSRPAWNLVMIGPVAKIDDADLPQAPNIHYLGMKPYDDLPAYLAHFDVALVPFATNDATRFLSPTKTVEYMAAHKPVVATPIPDIGGLYGDYVEIAETPEAFAAAVARALDESAAERAARRRREKELLERCSWDGIAGQMRDIVAAQLAVASMVEAEL